VHTFFGREPDTALRRGTERNEMTTLWQTLTGTETHCSGCGKILLTTLESKYDEVYCSGACERNVQRLSSFPPPPPEEDITEHRDIPFGRI
jgi:hypothetical protein